MLQWRKDNEINRVKHIDVALETMSAINVKVILHWYPWFSLPVFNHWLWWTRLFFVPSIVFFLAFKRRLAFPSISRTYSWGIEVRSFIEVFYTIVFEFGLAVEKVPMAPHLHSVIFGTVLHKLCKLFVYYGIHCKSGETLVCRKEHTYGESKVITPILFEVILFHKFNKDSQGEFMVSDAKSGARTTCEPVYARKWRTVWAHSQLQSAQDLCLKIVTTIRIMLVRAIKKGNIGKSLHATTRNENIRLVRPRNIHNHAHSKYFLILWSWTPMSTISSMPMLTKFNSMTPTVVGIRSSFPTSVASIWGRYF